MILLDTCTLIWLTCDQKRLSEEARALIRRHPAELFVSSITALEVGLKHRKGALQLSPPPPAWFPHVLEFHGVREVPVNGDIATRSSQLPPVHNDPFDRLILATAEANDFILLSPDPAFREYPDVRVVW